MPARIINPEDLVRGLNKNVQSLLAVKGRGISVQGSKGLDLSSVWVRLMIAAWEVSDFDELDVTWDEVLRDKPCLTVGVEKCRSNGSYGLRPAQNEEEACMTFLLECGWDKAYSFRRLQLQLDLKGQHDLSRLLGETGFLTANRIFHDHHIVRPLPRPS